MDALNLLGKDIARRAKSKCELTGESGPLRLFDLEGPDVQPDPYHVCLLSELAIGHLEGKKPMEAECRYLEHAVWSDLAPVRKAAIRILEKLGTDWAQEAIENAHMIDATQSTED